MAWLLGLAAVGWIGVGVGFGLEWRRALHAYLAAYAWGVTLALGALLFLAIVNAMNATWPVAVRRIAEQLAATLVLFAVLFVPIFVGMSELYPWMRPDSFIAPELHRLVMHRRAYYNVPFFVARWIVVFATWIGFALVLRRLSLRQELGDGAPLRQRICRGGTAALIPLALTLSVASFDWLMSLTPTWYSTVFGFYFFAGSFLGGLALVTFTSALVQGRGGLGLRPSHYHALGRLMLAFTAFWGYIAYFQFMLVWIANRPVEGEWFRQRSSGSWYGVSVALVLGHFAVPFIVLLSYRLKRSRRFLAFIAAWIVAFHYLDSYWLVLPAFSREGFRPSWVDAAAALAIVCSAAALAVALLRRASLLSTGDPVLARALEYEAR